MATRTTTVNTIKLGVEKIKPKKHIVETFKPHQKSIQEIREPKSAQRQAIVLDQKILANKEILYLIKGIDQELTNLKLLTNLAKWVNAIIHIVFWSSTLLPEKEYAIFKQKKLALLEQINWTPVKCTLYIQPDSKKLLPFLIDEDSLFALAFHSKQEQLTNSIFDHSSLHEDILVLDL